MCEIVRRYIQAYEEKYGSLNGVEVELKEYIHGIEIEDVAYNQCKENLNKVFDELQLSNVTIDLRHANTLKVHDYDGKMDYVIGNPPYVRVHNFEENFDDVKSFSFARGGMSDTYLVFFEIGFNMLRHGGRLCYITPSSWINSLAGSQMRSYIQNARNLLSIIDLGHFQPFKASTYTMISLFEKGACRSEFEYCNFLSATNEKSFVCNIPFDKVQINDRFYITDLATLDNLQKILTTPSKHYVSVKNGFATLADKVFICASFPFDQFLIPVIKASTGRWAQAFYPYDKSGKPYAKEIIFSNPLVAEYLYANMQSLLKDKNEEENSSWFLYGRTQALKDVWSDKISVNVTIKDVKSLKINEVRAGSGVYSGLYILSAVSFQTIADILRSEDFIRYVASLKKYKSGGYYTFNSKDLELYLNYQIGKLYQSEHYDK